MLGKLSINALDVFLRGFRLVNFIQRNNNRNARSLGVVDALNTLRHDAVVRGNDQHNNVGDLGAARAHVGEGLVARRINKGDDAIFIAGFDRSLKRARCLRDSAGLARGNVGVTNAVKQTCLAVIDVTHDGDHGTARTLIAAHAFLESSFDDFGGAARLFDHQFNVKLKHGFKRLIGGDHAVNCGSCALHKELFQNVAGLHASDRGEFLDVDGLGNFHHASDWTLLTRGLERRFFICRGRAILAEETGGRHAIFTFLDVLLAAFARWRFSTSSATRIGRAHTTLISIRRARGRARGATTCWRASAATYSSATTTKAWTRSICSLTSARNKSRSWRRNHIGCLNANHARTRKTGLDWLLQHWTNRTHIGGTRWNIGLRWWTRSKKSFWWRNWRFDCWRDWCRDWWRDWWRRIGWLGLLRGM